MEVAVFANFLIGLREGLEAALVVGILIAFVRPSGQKALIRRVWAGVLAAIALSLAIGTFFTLSVFHLTEETQELIAGVLSLVTAVLIGGMVVWMARHSGHIKSELESKAAIALTASPLALTALAFFAVAREGLETAIFLWNGIVAAGSVSTPVVAALAGIAFAIALVWGMYQGVVRVNLRKFFQISSALLIFVAAGIAGYGVHELQEVGVLPGAGNALYDISWLLNTDSFVGALLSGLFNFNPDPTALETAAWVVVLVATAALYNRVSHRGASAQVEPQAVPAG